MHVGVRRQVPRSLPAWRAALPSVANTGLALRWVAALVEMEPTLALPDHVRDQAVRRWREVAPSPHVPDTKRNILPTRYLCMSSRLGPQVPL